MSASILQRIYAIADASSDPKHRVETDAGGMSLYAALASVARKLAGDDDAAAKAHTITGVITKLEPAAQERLVAAVEGLAKQ